MHTHKFRMSDECIINRSHMERLQMHSSFSGPRSGVGSSWSVAHDYGRNSDLIFSSIFNTFSRSVSHSAFSRYFLFSVIFFPFSHSVMKSGVMHKQPRDSEFFPLVRPFRSDTGSRVANDPVRISEFWHQRSCRYTVKNGTVCRSLGWYCCTSFQRA